MDFKLVTHNEESDIRKVLGLRIERCDELDDLAIKVLAENDADQVDAFQECINLAKSNEELVYLLYMYAHATGHICEHQHPGTAVEILVDIMKDKGHIRPDTFSKN